MTRCIAEYDQKIYVEQIDGTADAHGHIDLTADSSWAQLMPAYAKCESKGGREFWKVHIVEADISHVWWIPWSKTADTITPKMRIKHKDVVYEIVSVININLANDEIEIQTRRTF